MQLQSKGQFQKGLHLNIKEQKHFEGTVMDNSITDMLYSIITSEM